MSNIEIKSDVLKSLILSQTKALDALKSVAGQRIDRVQELCDLVGITKRDLAAALVFRSKGNITFVELAHHLSVNESTVRRWPEIHRALKAK